MSYNKQQTIHLLPVPFEIADVIISFLFKEIKTFIEEKKREIVEKFKHACYSRKNLAENFSDHNWETREHWAVCLDTIYGLGCETQIQGINCKICGNYKHSQIEIKENSKCVCLIE